MPAHQAWDREALGPLRAFKPAALRIRTLAGFGRWLVSVVSGAAASAREGVLSLQDQGTCSDIVPFDCGLFLSQICARRLHCLISNPLEGDCSIVANSIRC